MKPEERARAMDAIEEIIAERKRQIEVEGWTPEHDDEHSRGEMVRAAMSYCQSASFGGDTRRLEKHPPTYWPWSASWWKPRTARRDLVKAAALIVAEIERIDRLPGNPHVGVGDTP